MYRAVKHIVGETIMSNSRSWRLQLKNTASGDVVEGAAMLSAKGTYACTTSTQDLELGAICSASWEIELDTRVNTFVDKEYEISLYLVDLTTTEPQMIGDPIPMGIFKCVKAPRTGNGRTLTLYDKLYNADKPYTPSVTLPAKSAAIEQDICSKLGITYEEETRGLLDINHRWLLGLPAGSIYGTVRLAASKQDFTINNIPDGATMRQMLSYIAGMRGEFGYIDREGVYRTRWYNAADYTIDTAHADEPTLSEGTNHIAGLSCKVSDSVTLTAGSKSGRVLSFENPLMTQQVLNVLWTRVRYLYWHTASLNHRLGDPRLDVGDIVTLESTENGNNSIPITNIEYSFDGGLSATVRAAGMTEEGT